jgi:AcrR family transcriptional regulator
MPRKPDGALEGRIVDVAYRLWSEQGEDALTMRAVARAAKTTTPTLYQRFRDKKDLKHFLEERARQSLFDTLQPAASALEICSRALEFISKHGREYRLLATDWPQRLVQRMPMRSFDHLKKMLAHELGGEAAEHHELAFQLFSQVHGTALLRPEGKEHQQIAAFLTASCLKACATLVRDAAKKTGSRERSH